MSETERKTTIFMPASVLTYFSDSATRMAADLILSQRRPSIPEDVKWGELGLFYRANLAAKQIEAEHAILLVDIWTKTCRNMPSDWTRPQPHEQGEDCAADLRTLWNESCFTREYFKDGFGCEIAICIGKEEGLQVGYGLWHDGETLLAENGPDGWEWSEEYCWSPEGAVSLQENIDLLKLRDFAREGRKYILKLVGLHEQRVV